MSYTQNHGPDAPTRLARIAGDTLSTRVYYVPDSKIFIMIDRRAEPNFFNAVIVRRHPDGAIEIEPYEGQRHIGVVRVLENLLPHLELWCPRLCTVMLGCASLIG